MPDELQRQRLFEQCVNTHAESMYRVAFRLTGTHDLANELVQETYLNAWAKIGSLKSPEKMRSWMFAILRNQYTKLLRGNIRLKQLAPLAEEQLAAPSLHESESTAERVRTAIQQLDDEHKFPVLLVSMEGQSVDEAAEILGIPKGTVLSRLHRGRAKLKTLLSREIEAYNPSST